MPTHLVGRPQKPSVPRGLLTPWLISEADCAGCSGGIRRAPWGSSLLPWQPAPLRPLLWASADPSAGLLQEDGGLGPAGQPDCPSSSLGGCPLLPWSASHLCPLSRGCGVQGGQWVQSLSCCFRPELSTQRWGPARSLPGSEPARCCPPVPGDSLLSWRWRVDGVSSPSCHLARRRGSRTHRGRRTWRVSDVSGLLPPAVGCAFHACRCVPAAGCWCPSCPVGTGALTGRGEALVGAPTGCHAPCQVWVQPGNGASGASVGVGVLGAAGRSRKQESWGVSRLTAQALAEVRAHGALPCPGLRPEWCCCPHLSQASLWFFGSGLRVWFASRPARETLRAPCPRSGHVRRARQVPRRRQELVTPGRQQGR